MEACHYFYDPTEAKPEFVVHFEGADEAHTKRAQKVIAHLETLEPDELLEESVLFFKWLVLHRLSPEFQPYTEALLGFSFCVLQMKLLTLTLVGFSGEVVLQVWVTKS